MRSPASLTRGSISRGLLIFALPILFGNVLQSLNGSVNSIWVGHYLGEAALSATANANTVMFLLLGGVFGLSMAATILVGQYIGARNMPEARKVVGTSTTFFFLVSFLLSLIGWLECEPLLRSMSTPADALPYAVSYMRVIFVALPFMYLYAFVMAVLRGAGDSRISGGDSGIDRCRCRGKRVAAGTGIYVCGDDAVYGSRGLQRVCDSSGACGVIGVAGSADRAGRTGLRGLMVSPLPGTRRHEAPGIGQLYWRHGVLSARGLLRRCRLRRRGGLCLLSGGVGWLLLGAGFERLCCVGAGQRSGLLVSLLHGGC